MDEDFKLNPFDEVEFFNYFDTNPRNSVTIKGEVYKEGEIFIDRNTDFFEVLKLAGGLTKRAYIEEFELIRYALVDNERVRTIKRVSFEDVRMHGLELKDGDEITIFTIPNWYDTKQITLKGEVKFPGIYTIKTGEKLSDVIKRAGGYTKQAFINGAIFTRESIKVNEEKRMKESMLKIKQQMAFISANGKQLGAEKSSAADLVATINLLEEQTKDYEAVGRLVVYLDKDLQKFEKSEFNIRLEDGDTLTIPSFNDTVSVYGEVMNPGSFVFNSTKDADDYIEQAGGVSDKSDTESIYIVYANGEAKKINSGYLFGMDSDYTVPTGSTIVVPMKIDQVSGMLVWKEVSQIVYQLAVTAASLDTLGAL